MDFGRALGIAFTTGGARKLREGEVDETEQVGWGYGLAGIAIAVVAQLVLLLLAEETRLNPRLFQISVASLVALAVPVLLFWLTAAVTGTLRRLPAAFLHLGIVLAVVQIMSALLARVGIGQHVGFVIGLLFAAVALGSSGFFKVGWLPAIGIGVLTLGGFFSSGVLLAAWGGYF